MKIPAESKSNSKRTHNCCNCHLDFDGDDDVYLGRASSMIAVIVSEGPKRPMSGSKTKSKKKRQKNKKTNCFGMLFVLVMVLVVLFHIHVEKEEQKI